MGVNSRAELADAEQKMQTRLRGIAMAAGVGMSTAPKTVFYHRMIRCWKVMSRLSPLLCSVRASG